jgi:hypothetical protein
MTKRLPPPGGNGSKLPTRQPPPGHSALEKDFFVRFDELTDLYDTLVEEYKELKHVSGSFEVRWRMRSLEPWGADDDVLDRLEWLWPAVENIHWPPRDYYAKRASFLVGSFPSSAPHSPQAYIKMLVSAILVKAPSCMVLEAACWELTTTYKYSNAPNIADLMTLIEKHTKLWDERLRIHDEIESGRAREFAEGRLAYELEREQKRVDDVVRRLTEVNQLELATKVREGGIDMIDEAMPTLEKLERVNSVVHRLTLVKRPDLAAKVRKGGIDMVDEVMQTLDDLEREQTIERAEQERAEQKRREERRRQKAIDEFVREGSRRGEGKRIRF